MKRLGFTLAEVLVTLGIIGVVAALTTPALIQNVGNAKVGPKLQKAKATFETAAEMMLTENNANTIRAISTDATNLGKELSKFMKITPNDTTITYLRYTGNSSYGTMPNSGIKRFDSDDGLIYYINILAKRAVDTNNYADIPNNVYTGVVRVDINGADGPNRMGKDLFQFALYNDGTLRPWGAKGFYRSSEKDDKVKYWNVNENCDQGGVVDELTCAGSIFENGMKIIYQ